MKISTPINARRKANHLATVTTPVRVDGKLVYSSTGEVIDQRTRKIIAALKDENGDALDGALKTLREL